MLYDVGLFVPQGTTFNLSAFSFDNDPSELQSEFFLCIWTSDPAYDSDISNEASILECANTDDDAYSFYVPTDVTIDLETGVPRIQNMREKYFESGFALRAIRDENLDALPRLGVSEFDRIDDDADESMDPLFNTRTRFSDSGDEIFPNVTGVFKSIFERFTKGLSKAGEVQDPKLFSLTEGVYFYQQSLDFDPRIVISTFINGTAFLNEGKLIPYACVQNVETGGCNPDVIESYWNLCIWTDVDNDNYVTQCSWTGSLADLLTSRPIDISPNNEVEQTLAIAQEPGSAREAVEDIAEFPKYDLFPLLFDI